MPIAAGTNIVVALVFASAAALHLVDVNLYYNVAQEDRFLEWFTFWAFVAAGAVFFRSAALEWKTRVGLPWFMFGLGLFCLLVALEEISWGQRLLGYRPPDYFLEENYQQEFNLHNIVDTSLRKLAMYSLLIGYGVVLALLAQVPTIGRRLHNWRIVAPPAGFAASFGLIALVYAWYPYSFSGEWVEAATGIALLGVALSARPVAEQKPGRALAVQLLGVMLVSAATLGALTLRYGTDSARVQIAQAESAAIARDFAGPRLVTRCNIHKRLYTFMRDYNQPYLAEGAFAELVREQGESTRADYLLDPWNSPYWVRHRCTEDRAVAFVYSFGPNRRRDSSDWQIMGDDVGAQLID